MSQASSADNADKIRKLKADVAESRGITNKLLRKAKELGHQRFTLSEDENEALNTKLHNFQDWQLMRVLQILSALIEHLGDVIEKLKAKPRTNEM